MATPEQGLRMVRDASMRLFESIKKEGLNLDTNRERLYELIDRIVFSNFDFYRISSRVLGKSWGAATPEQKERFIGQFKTHLLHSYATALDKYDGQEIEYLPMRVKQPARLVKVQTRVRLTEAAPINIDYILFLSQGDSWRVVDVLVEGVSLVVTHRSSFQMEINQKGLSGLIAVLEERNKKLREPQNPNPSDTELEQSPPSRP